MSIIGHVSLTATDAVAFTASLDRLMALADSAVDHGGRFLARGGSLVAAVGDSPPDRVLVLEFEHVGQARSWMGSPEFAAFTDLASACCDVGAMIVEGQ